MYSMKQFDNFLTIRSPDGQCLILSSRDGYCTLVVFDEIFPAHHTQQQALQLQSIAHQHSVPITPAPHTSQHSHAGTSSRAVTPSYTPVFGNVGLPTSHAMSNASASLTPSKRTSSANTSISEHASVPPQDMDVSSSSTPSANHPGEPMKRIRDELDHDDDESSVEKVPEPVKKKRRVALTRVGDLGS
jgi:chromatin assembly factor 1 subunit B